MSTEDISSKKHLTYSGRSKFEEYGMLEKDLDRFFKENPIDTTGRMATLSAYLRFHFPRNYFCGFYTVVKNKEVLQIGPYNGNGMVLASGIIDFGKGVCGTCAATRVTQIVPDVRLCNNYIACDEDSLSEIVVPVFARNRHDEQDVLVSDSKTLIGVLDLDADIVNAYDEVDKECLERILSKYF
jgi:L-methionine (R)-S-oxide reductase